MARTVFILTKLLSNTISALIFIVALPGLVALGETYLATQKMIPLLPFLVGSGIVLLGLIFFISLVILLGVLFESRGAVLGIAFGLMFGGQILRNIIPPLLYVLPLSMDGIALSAMQGMPLKTIFVSQLLATTVLIIVVVLVALRRSKYIEL